MNIIDIKAGKIKTKLEKVLKLCNSNVWKKSVTINVSVLEHTENDLIDKRGSEFVAPGAWGKRENLNFKRTHWKE